MPLSLYLQEGLHLKRNRGEMHFHQMPLSSLEGMTYVLRRVGLLSSSHPHPLHFLPSESLSLWVSLGHLQSGDKATLCVWGGAGMADLTAEGR